MKIAVTTPAGHIGSVAVGTLLDQGVKPVLIARHPEKLQHAVDRGATVIQADHGDAASLTAATVGVDTLFVCVPADMTITDIHAWYRKFAEAAAAAATANGISHVVLLSSAGADLERGNGPVAGLYLAEKILSGAGIPHLTFLRPGYFMENTLAQIPTIAQAGKLFTTFPQGVTFPMIATRDIGVRAAQALRESPTEARRVVELHGGEITGYDEVAGVLSQVLQRDVEHVSIPGEAFVGALTQAGVSTTMAEALVELSDGIVNGSVAHREPRGPGNVTPTDYRAFAHEVFAPAMAQAAQA